MTNDDKVKLANEILAITEDPLDLYSPYEGGCKRIAQINTHALKSIVSEWLQFTQLEQGWSGDRIDILRKVYADAGYTLDEDVLKDAQIFANELVTCDDCYAPHYRGK
jgi:hypothetical protein